MKDEAAARDDDDHSAQSCRERENKIFDLVLNMNSTSKPTSLARAQGGHGQASMNAPAIPYQSPAYQMRARSLCASRQSYGTLSEESYEVCA